MAVRVDLRFPPTDEYDDMPTCFFTMDNAISRFIDSLNAKLRHNLIRSRIKGKRTHLNRLRYVWAKEQVSSEHHHYHCVLIINKDAHYKLGDYDLDKPTLRTMITKAWYSALQLELDPIIDKGTLVEYPDNCAYWVNQGSPTFEADYAALVQRMNYLAKDYSKHYNASSRSIGYSLS